MTRGNRVRIAWADMRPFVRRAASCLATAAALAAGCIKMKQQLMLLPDGSGKLTVTLASPVTEKPGGLLGLLSAPQTEDEATESAATMAEGLAAITDLRITRSEKESVTSFVGWFEDVNKVRLGRRAEDNTTFRWARDGDGFALVVVPGEVVDLATKEVKKLDELAAAPPEQRELLRKFADLSSAMFVGLELRTELRLPGPVMSVEGLTRFDDRSVGVQLVQADLADEAKVRALATTTFRARCGPSVISPSEMSAFRADLAKAKASWAANPASRVVASTRETRCRDSTTTNRSR
jgi:hypothetical protein